MLISPYVIPGLPRTDVFHTCDRAFIFERIAHLSCAVNGISFSELMGRSRYRPVIMGRCMVSRILRDIYNFSFSEIGRLMGGKHHTTILHHIGVHDSDMTVNSQGYRDKYFSLLKEI